MKTFLKIIAAVVTLFIVVTIGLNLYFTDERLKNTVMPYVNEAVGRTVEVESMSLTLFSTFPQPGLSIKKMSIPGEIKSDTLFSLDELVVSVKLFSLLGDQIDIAEIRLANPKFTYEVYSDSSTNIDFLTNTEETPQDTSAGLAINIPYFAINNGNFGYKDATSKTELSVNDLNANISLSYADLIKSKIDLQLGGLTASSEGKNYVNNLPLSLSQASTIDLENETVTLDNGTFSIRGLALNLSGTLSDWSNTLTGDLTFNSSSDNFGELLQLVPAEYQEYTDGLETKGTLAIDGSLKGALMGDTLPAFDVTINVTEGYLKNPDLPKPIENIQLAAKASNQSLSVEKLSAVAGENNLSASGNLTDPLEENGNFSMNVKADVNLATISEFYDISEFDIESMNGQLAVDGTANGNRNAPDQATFDATINLTNGAIKYAEVPKPIENISVDADANQSVITIKNMQLQAAANTFSMKGKINQPLKENQRSIDLSTNLDFDLATIKDFYPIDEDTLEMRGKLTANATLKGKADQIEKAVQSGKLTLSNGYIRHKSLAKPIEDFTLNSSLDGPTLSVSKASFRTGNNNLSANGTIKNYLSDNRELNLKLNGKAALDQIQSYYELSPTITKLTGRADLNLQASGPLANPENMRFNGQLKVQDVHMEGDGLVQPVSNLKGELELSPKSASLQSLNFKIGSSDIALKGSLKDYMEYLKAKDDRKVTPHLEGSYKSELFNLDELINWEDTSAVTETPIHLPDLTSSVSAEIRTLIATGVTMKNLKANAGTTPKQIKMDKASIELFDGQASGSFIWDVPQPERTSITFSGSLKNLETSTFFKEYQVLGKKSKFHKHVSGKFNATVNYSSDLNVYLEPLIKTTTMNGDFGMTKSRLKGHPIQQELAKLLKAKELENAALDEWKSTYTLKNSVLTIKNLKITSADIGMELSGTQHLETGSIDYQTKLFLPGRYQKAIASVITKKATEALTQKNGTIMVPLRITGTQEKPKISPDQEVIGPIVKDYLKGKAGDLIKGLFEG